MPLKKKEKEWNTAAWKNILLIKRVVECGVVQKVKE